ncbi:MAG: hypothetical protein ABIS18_08105 [Actinomycetota bacterium]
MEAQSILFVCTGNICRSPMALGFAQSIAAKCRLPISLSSAGLLSSGNAATEEAVKVMAEQDIDISPHISTTLDVALSRGPNFVIAMANAHLNETISRDPSLRPRTFTLKDFVRRARAMGQRDGPMEGYLSALGRGRSLSEMASALASDDDIEDPFGGPMSQYRECAIEIRSLVEDMIEHLYPRHGSLLR